MRLVSGLVIAAKSQLPYSNIMSADDRSLTVQKRGYFGRRDLNSEQCGRLMRFYPK